MEKELLEDQEHSKEFRRIKSNFYTLLNTSSLFQNILNSSTLFSKVLLFPSKKEKKMNRTQKISKIFSFTQYSLSACPTPNSIQIHSFELHFSLQVFLNTAFIHFVLQNNFFIKIQNSFSLSQHTDKQTHSIKSNNIFHQIFKIQKSKNFKNKVLKIEHSKIKK